jgi:uncharacterized protein (TIGR03437 family)
MFHGFDIATDAQGNVYIADFYNNRIRRVTPGGIISTIAGTGDGGCTGDGGLATNAALGFPVAVAVDSKGVIYTSCEFTSIRKITPDGKIGTLASLPSWALGMEALACDQSGNVYAATATGGGSQVFRVSPDGTTTLFAGSGGFFYNGDGIPATQANLWTASGVAVDAAANLYIADESAMRIRKVDPSGIISTLAGNGISGFSGDGGPASAAQVSFPTGMAIDSNGDLLFGNYDRVRRILLTATPPQIELAAGGGTVTFRDGPANTAVFGTLMGIARDGAGNLYVADPSNDRVRMIAADGTVSTVAGNGSTCSNLNGQPATATCVSPFGVAFDSKGNLWMSDLNRIREITPSGQISTEAGNAVGGCDQSTRSCNPVYQSNVPALTQGLLTTTFIAIDGQDNVYFLNDMPGCGGAVCTGQLVELSKGLLSPVTGTVTNGTAKSSVSFNSAAGIASDANGNLYISNGTAIQKVDPSGNVMNFAGTPGKSGDSGDGGPASAALLSAPSALKFGNQGNLYVVDGPKIRKISSDGALFQTIAAVGVTDLAIDPAGVIYGTSGNRILKLSPVPAVGLSAVSGNNQSGTIGAQLAQPLVVSVVDSNGQGPFPGVVVQFTVVSGSAKLNSNQVTTGADGTASVTVTLGSQAGAIVITASVPGLQSATFALTAQAPCSFSLSQTAIAAPSAGLYGSLNLTASAVSCTWSAASANGWVTLTSAANGAGNASVAYVVAPNTGPARGAVLTVAGISVAVTQQAGPPGPLVYPSGVVSAASFSAGISSGAWIAIMGVNLAPDTRPWLASDFVGTQLPTSLDGVSVRINGKAAYLSYISPNQINALAPADAATGSVDVQVIAPNGTSQSVSAQKTAFTPAVFVFDPGRRYAAAVLLDGTYAGPVGLFGAAASSRPPVPGDTIQLFATGLGATAPPYPDGQLISAAIPLANLVTVSVGGKNASVQFAGLVTAGCYQINLTVPQLPPGDAPIQLSIGGVASQSGVFLAIGQ